MRRVLRLLKWLVFGVISAILGLLSLGPFFLPGLAPGESILGRIMAVLIFFLVAGVIVGYSNPEAWGITGVMAWGGALTGISRLLSGQGSRLEGVALLMLPLFVSLCAGYLGMVIHQRAPWQRRIKRDKGA